MRDRLFSLLGIEPGEETMVSGLLMQSIFLGIFFGAFDISAHSLFLSIFDEKMMAKGYVVSGIAGIILTSLYTWVQTRMQFRNFAIINLITVTAFTLILWVGLVLYPVSWVIFIVFIMFGPLNILAMLGFWGTAGRLFTLRQGKRLFGLVDAGLIIGIIISCYTIPLLLTLNLGSHNIILISALSVLVATVFQILIRSRFNVVPESRKQKTEDEEDKKSVFLVFREDPYTRIMAVFIILSVITAFFIQYSFMAVTREQYPAAEDMVRFLGIFTGSMMLFTFMVKLLVFSYLIRNYGLRTCLTISPLLIAFFTIIAITVGMLMGYTLESASGFLIFFLLMALSRLFSKALKDSIESPSFKIIYQTINEKIRYKIQSGMDGTVNEIAALSSGLLLAILGTLSFIRLIHFSWVLLVIVIVWLFAAFQLYREYRKSIRKALEPVLSDSPHKNSDVKNLYKSRFSAETDFRRDYFSLVSGDHTLLETKQNNWYYKRIIEFSLNITDISLIPVLKKIAIDKKIDGEIRKSASEVLTTIEKSLKNNAVDDKLISARKNLLNTRLPQTTEILRLLRDNSIESKRIGIFMIGKYKLADMLAEIIDCLNIQGLENDALSVLQGFNSFEGKELERFYLISSGNTITGNTILRLLGKSGSKENIEFLFSRLWSNSRHVKEIVLKSLIDCGFIPSSEDKDRLHQLISDVIGIMVWNLSAKVCLEKNNDIVLAAMMRKEIDRWNKFLFNILKITYEGGSISKIHENLSSDTVESVNYALEMIDIVVDDSIKPRLTSLLDVVTDEAKLRNLFHFYPGEIPQYDELLDDILNRDYNLISIWSKASTLRKLTELEGDDLTESVIALLFSPEQILQEESARLITRTSHELFRTVSKRLPSSMRTYLTKITNGKNYTEDLLFEKVQFLSGCFKSISEDELLPLAGKMKCVRSSKEASLFTSGDFISWRIPVGNQLPCPQLHYSGNSNSPVYESESHSYYLLPFKAIEEHQYQFPEDSPGILTYIENYEV
jgi:ATP:ADP antiporter, AAA family